MLISQDICPFSLQGLPSSLLFRIPLVGMLDRLTALLCVSDVELQLSYFLQDRKEVPEYLCKCVSDRAFLGTAVDVHW